MDIRDDPLSFLNYVIEMYDNVFSEIWLNNQRRRGLARNRRFDHIVIEIYDFLKGLVENNNIRSIEYKDLRKIIGASFYIISIDESKNLVGYKSGLPNNKLKDKSEFERFEFIARIANLLVSNYETIFLPVSAEHGIKTPDLICMNETDKFYVEVKKKDRYIRPINYGSRSNAAINSILKRYENLNLTITIVLIDEIHPRILNGIVECLDNYLENHVMGLKLHDSGFYIHIEESQPRYDSNGIIGGFQSTNLRTGHLLSDFQMDEYGGVAVVKEFKIEVLGLDSAKINSITESMYTAMTQIGDDGCGYIAVEMDTSHVSDNRISMFRDIIIAAIYKRLQRIDYINIIGVIITYSPKYYQVNTEVRFGSFIDVIYRDDNYVPKILLPRTYFTKEYVSVDETS